MIDIIMAAYNGAEYIGEQIESILASSKKDFRLLIYDDGSQDETAGIVKNYAGKYPGKLFYFYNENRFGHCANFLQGLVRARNEYPADYYMFSDQDDLWLKDKISICLERIKDYSSPCMVFTDAMLVDADANPLGMTLLGADRLNTAGTDLAHLLMENKCQGCTMMINSALAAMVDKFDDRVRYHDWWIALIASAFGNIVFIDTPTLMHRQHESNVVGQKSFSGYLAGRISKGAADSKERLKATYRQAAAFYKYYGKQMSRKDKKLVHEFVMLPKMNAAQKRTALVKYGFLKSGMIRNIGLMIYV